jgi:HEAT repeat protein
MDLSPLRWTFARLPLAVLLLAAGVSAHGGAYRGPGTPVVPGPPGPGPTTGGPAGPGAPGGGPSTGGGGPAITEEAGWQLWWERNRDPWITPRPAPETGPTTGSDDFYLGRRRREPTNDLLQPSTDDLDNLIVPTLTALLESERNRDIQTACLMALAKIGRNPVGGELVPLLAERLRRDDQEVRETAALALGVSGQKAALPLLLALLNDESEGRRLMDRSEVTPRTRAFAAYGAALLVRNGLATDAGAAQQVHDALWPIAQNDSEKNRDLRIAAVNGLGVLCDPLVSRANRVAWQTVDELFAWYQTRLGRADELIQAQAPVAIGRLLGRGNSAVHERMKQHFAKVLNGADKRSNPILQSCALALGMLALPPEQHEPDAEVAEALQRHFDKGTDRLARYFAVMAMGRIGGPSHRQWLLATYGRANRSTERPWLAMALGLIGHAAAANGTGDALTAQLLLEDLPTAPKPDAQSAYAVALGLCAHRPAAPLLTRLLRENEADESLSGYLCLGLALLGEPGATTTLSTVMVRAQRRPFLLLQAAIGLGRLGERSANEQLLAMLRDSSSTAVLATLANAIGQIGDRRAIEPLRALATDPNLTRLARAFVAAALGGIGDRFDQPWNEPLCRDSNYGAPVDTLSNGSTGVLDIL